MHKEIFLEINDTKIQWYQHLSDETYFYFIAIESIISWWKQGLKKFILSCKQIKGNSSKTAQCLFSCCLFIQLLF